MSGGLSSRMLSNSIFVHPLQTIIFQTKSIGPHARALTYLFQGGKRFCGKGVSLIVFVGPHFLCYRDNKHFGVSSHFPSEDQGFQHKKPPCGFSGTPILVSNKNPRKNQLNPVLDLQHLPQGVSLYTFLDQDRKNMKRTALWSESIGG